MCKHETLQVQMLSTWSLMRADFYLASPYTGVNQSKVEEIVAMVILTTVSEGQ